MKSARSLINGSEKGILFQSRKHLFFSFFSFMESSFVSSASRAC